MRTATSSSSNVGGPKVFLNFRGEELRKTFVSNLSEALNRSGINAFIDSQLGAGQKLATLFEIIEESDIALAILSSRYTESEWCLKELVKMKECCTKGEGCKNLLVIPIFYKLETSIVKELGGSFGTNLFQTWRKQGGARGDQIAKWDGALQDVLSYVGLEFKENGEEKDFVDEIVGRVKDALTQIGSQSQEKKESTGAIVKPQTCLSRASINFEPEDPRLRQLEGKLDVECNDIETRVVGIVGMPGIGKTYLAQKLFVTLKKKIDHYVFIKFESEKSKVQGSKWLEKRLVEGLLDQHSISADGDAPENWKSRLGQIKILVVLDNVIDREQICDLFGNCDWIQKGSKIIITTRDKSFIEGLGCDLYEVPGLNETDGLELFKAQVDSNLEGNFMEMSRKFVDFCGGNPLALMAFGEELNGKEEDEWVERLGTLKQISNVKVRNFLRDVYEKDLDEKQKDTFLEIVCFFRSHNEDYVRSLLDSTEAGREIRHLEDKFLIHISDGRVEMHNLQFTMGKELVETTTRKYWMLSSNSALSTDALKNRTIREEVRGIVIDMAKVEEMPLNNQAFVGMSSLRYLKVYNSLNPNHSETECKLNLPDGLKLPEDNIVRYLHWIYFPDELPFNFQPENLIDLSLPYSKITHLWSCAKVTPKLTRVDLSHSSKLTSISGLSNAPNLLRLDLEGCMALENLPQEMQKMSKLVLLNLRGCTNLSSLPNIYMDSLKTLILSGCSKLKTFEVISEHLETIYLDSTGIVGLPPIIGNLHELIFLSLKDCKDLETLPDCLGEMKSLQELNISRCSNLKTFPDIKKIRENLRVLLLDGTAIAEMPRNMADLSSLQRLCLSRNDKMNSLHFDMGQMFHLKWLELKHCKNLTSLPRLPPNLQCLIATGCTSLRTVTTPQALRMSTEQIHSTFIFTNCHELEQISKNAIISYIKKRSELMSADRHNEDFVFKSLIGTCFPGCEIPAWFNHQASGSVLELELPQDWNAGRFIRIALSAVISFKEYKDQNTSFQVKCTCEFTNNASLRPESFIVGGWSNPSDEPCTVEADHIFMGCTSFTNIKKCQQFSSPTKVSFRFEVTNGTSVVPECKVMKCGFSLLYESDEAEYATWEAPPSMESNNQGQSSSTSLEIDDECRSEAGDVTP